MPSEVYSATCKYGTRQRKVQEASPSWSSTAGIHNYVTETRRFVQAKKRCSETKPAQRHVQFVGGRVGGGGVENLSTVRRTSNRKLLAFSEPYLTAEVVLIPYFLTQDFFYTTQPTVKHDTRRSWRRVFCFPTPKQFVARFPEYVTIVLWLRG